MSIPQCVFAIATSFYPAVFFLTCPAHPSPISVAKIRETLSAFHCLLTTILCLICLDHHSALHLLSSQSLPAAHPGPTPNANLPIITTKSTFANAITTYETGYLIGDTLIVLYAQHVNRTPTKLNDPSPLSQRGLNTNHLLTHHIPLILAFLTLQLYIFLSLERGILIIIILMLQNFSSPFGTLRWYVNATYPHKQGSAFAADVAYITSYALCRVWLLYWVVARFSAIQRRGVLEGFYSLKWHCQLGTLTMAYINVSWLLKITMRAHERWYSVFCGPHNKPGSNNGDEKMA